jgi:UDPglucose 6-dehydrogenase
VAATSSEGRLFFSTRGAEAIKNADAVFIAVGTPSRRGDGHADLSYVYAAAEEIAGPDRRLHRDRHQVDRAGRHRRRDRGDHRPQGPPDAQFAVVSNPEFLREGAAIEDFKRPDRVVVGTDDDRAQAVMRELYRPLTSTRRRSCSPAAAPAS